MDIKTNAIRKLTCAAAIQAASVRAIKQSRRAYSGDLKHQIDLWLQTNAGKMCGAYGSIQSFKCSTRHLYLAKAFLREVPYRTVEPHTHWDKDLEFGLQSKHGFKPSWSLSKGVAQALLSAMNSTQAVEVLQELGYPPSDKVTQEREKLASKRASGAFVWSKGYRDAVRWSVESAIVKWMRVGSSPV